MSDVIRTNNPVLTIERDYFRLSWSHEYRSKVSVLTQGNGPPQDIPVEELEAFGRACVAMAEAIRSEGAEA